MIAVIMTHHVSQDGSTVLASMKMREEEIGSRHQET